MPTLFNFPPSTFLTNLFSSLLLHPDSLPLLLHSNSLQTVTASMLVLESTGSSLPSSSHHHTFLPSTTSPNRLSAVSPSSIPHSLPLPFTSFRDQVSGTLLEPQLLPTQTQVDYPFQPSTFFFLPPQYHRASTRQRTLPSFHHLHLNPHSSHPLNSRLVSLLARFGNMASAMAEPKKKVGNCHEAPASTPRYALRWVRPILAFSLLMLSTVDSKSTTTLPCMMDGSASSFRCSPSWTLDALSTIQPLVGLSPILSLVLARMPSAVGGPEVAIPTFWTARCTAHAFSRLRRTFRSISRERGSMITGRCRPHSTSKGSTPATL